MALEIGESWGLDPLMALHPQGWADALPRIMKKERKVT